MGGKIGQHQLNGGSGWVGRVWEGRTGRVRQDYGGI